MRIHRGFLCAGTIVTLALVGAACSSADTAAEKTTVAEVAVDEPEEGVSLESAVPRGSTLPRPASGGECLEGTWLSDNEFFAASLNEIAGDMIQDVTGEVFLTFEPDGSLVTEYRNWQLQAVQERTPMTIKRNGSDFGEYSLGDGTITFADQHMESVLTVSTAEFNMEVDPYPAAYADVPYTCDGDTASVVTPDGTATLQRQ